MVSFMYNVAKKGLVDGTLDFDTAGDDIRVILLEAASDENKDDADLAAVLARAGTTELTSTGYDRADGVATSEATTQDDTNDVAFFDAGNVTFSGVSQLASETVVAAVVFKFVTDDAGSTPILFIDDMTGMPGTPTGGDIVITWAATGIFQLGDA